MVKGETRKDGKEMKREEEGMNEREHSRVSPLALAISRVLHWYQAAALSQTISYKRVVNYLPLCSREYQYTLLPYHSSFYLCPSPCVTLSLSLGVPSSFRITNATC